MTAALHQRQRRRAPSNGPCCTGCWNCCNATGDCDSFRALDQGKVIDVANAPRTRELMNHLEDRGLRVIRKLARETCRLRRRIAVGCVSRMIRFR